MDDSVPSKVADLSSMTNEELLSFLDFIYTQLELRKHYLYQQGAVDEWIAPVAEGNVGSTITQGLFHSDIGRAAIYALRQIMFITKGTLVYLLGLRANVLVEYWFEQTDIDDRDYATPVIVIFLILVMLCLYDSLAEQSYGDQLYETDEERKKLYLAYVRRQKKYQ